MINPYCLSLFKKSGIPCSLRFCINSTTVVDTLSVTSYILYIAYDNNINWSTGYYNNDVQTKLWPEGSDKSLISVVGAVIDQLATSSDN